jgi:hypothetical protein
MSDDEGKVIWLPRDFIGKEDEARLESFGGHLIAHGSASRWHWERSAGIDLAFLIFAHEVGGDEQLRAKIGRDSGAHSYFAEDDTGRIFARGHLEAVMTVVDQTIRGAGPVSPA